MVDYTRLAATSERLITKNGREVIFKKPNLIPIDPIKPWNGPGKNSAVIELPLMAVFAPPNTVRQFGLTALGEGRQVSDLFSFVEKLLILFPGENNIPEYTTMTDNDGLDYNIVAYQLLKPAFTSVLAFVGVRR